MAEQTSTNPRTITGEVVSNKADKSITIRVVRRVKHPLYRKIISRASRIHVHDENNECNKGDIVTAMECRPMSKTKSFLLSSIDVRARES